MDSSLDTVCLPEGLKYLDTYAFALCYQLREVRMPAGLECFQGNAFLHCRNLKRITLMQGRPPMVVNQGIVMSFKNVLFELPAEALPYYQADDFWRKQNLVPMHPCY